MRSTHTVFKYGLLIILFSGVFKTPAFSQPKGAIAKKSREKTFDFTGFITGDFINPLYVEMISDQNQRVRVPMKLIKKSGYTDRDISRGKVLRLKLKVSEVKEITAFK